MAASRGFDPTGTVTISRRYGCLAPGATQRVPPLRVHPAALRAAAAAFAVELDGPGGRRRRTPTRSGGRTRRRGSRCRRGRRARGVAVDRREERRCGPSVAQLRARPQVEHDRGQCRRGIHVALHAVESVAEPTPRPVDRPATASTSPLLEGGGQAGLSSGKNRSSTVLEVGPPSGPRTLGSGNGVRSESADGSGVTLWPRLVD